MKTGPFEEWFAGRGWTPFAFQRRVWALMNSGASGLLHSATGSGKTLAVWFGALGAAGDRRPGGLRVLWITPMRALAADTEAALREPLDDLGMRWRVGRWTGDVSAHRKRRMRSDPGEALVITPESLALLLSQTDFAPHFQNLHTVIVDEWHELLSSKRGVLTELSLARLRTVAPGLRVWGLSATLGNTREAADVLGGRTADGGPAPMELVEGGVPDRVDIETLLPDPEAHFPWSGHLGLRLLPSLLARLREARTAIVFTNTRSQAELWHGALSAAAPDMAIGIHHGSIDRARRAEAEAGLRTGRLRAVVATSSLDLGVDFAPVERVVQVGSPKGVARLLQRAGRSGHQPGATSRILCVPTNSFELVEIAAARGLAEARVIEARLPPPEALDVLCQHLLTVAAGTGFTEESMLAEVRTTHAFRALDEQTWQWVLRFAATGGESLRAYAEFRRLERKGGKYRFTDTRLLRDHRMGIGTITADPPVEVCHTSGKRLGSVEEAFVARLKPGDPFLFSGRHLELVRLRDLRATVRDATAPDGVSPRWMGGRLPLSTQLATAVRDRFDRAARGIFEGAEMRRVRPLLEIQATMSVLPRKNEYLAETLRSREGWHLFLYPFAGRLAHEGLATVMAWRLTRLSPNSLVWAANDYGLELLAAKKTDFAAALPTLLRSANLADDILASVNGTELARRCFRGIARVAGLTREGSPGRHRIARRIQASSNLLFEVFRRYEPDHRLLAQSRREVLETQLEETRLRDTLRRMRGEDCVLRRIEAPTPLAYPLFVERLREQLSSEKLGDRVRAMEVAMEKAHRSHARA